MNAEKRDELRQTLWKMATQYIADGPEVSSGDVLDVASELEYCKHCLMQTVAHFAKKTHDDENKGSEDSGPFGWPKGRD